MLWLWWFCPCYFWDKAAVCPYCVTPFALLELNGRKNLKKKKRLEEKMVIPLVLSPCTRASKKWDARSHIWWAGGVWRPAPAAATPGVGACPLPPVVCPPPPVAQSWRLSVLLSKRSKCRSPSSLTPSRFLPESKLDSSPSSDFVSSII